MDLIPAARSVERPGGEDFVLEPGAAISADTGSQGAARWLRGALGAATGFVLPPSADSSSGGGGIALRLDRAVHAALGPEGYRLSVSEAGVEVIGGGTAGVFWGAQTLRQLLGPAAFRRSPVRQAGHWSIPAVRIEDTPRLRWRGMLLDVARHFTPKDGILRYLDLLAAHKLNILHLHLTDDQGWRIQINRYPELTRTGAWRPRTRTGWAEPPIWDERPHGGHYTQDDIREIVSYAAERHITVVPEIDIPGHSQAAIAAYPHLGNADVIDTTALSVHTSWTFNPNTLAPTESTLEFYENVLSEVLDLFPSQFIHMGGDECPKEQWRASATAQARIKELGLANEDELQSWFIRHFDTWLTRRGRRLIGWGEILQGGLAPGAAVASWEGFDAGITAALAGHDVVMCPQEHVYLDWRQEPDQRGSRVNTLERVYRFEPVPSQLTPEQAEHVIGAQANVWTEMMPSQQAVDFKVFPRLAAFAEVVWSTALPEPEHRDFADFTRRLDTHYARLDALGVEYHPPAGPHPWQQ